SASRHAGRGSASAAVSDEAHQGDHHRDQDRGAQHAGDDDMDGLDRDHVALAGRSLADAEETPEHGQHDAQEARRARLGAARGRLRFAWSGIRHGPAAAQSVVATDRFGFTLADTADTASTDRVKLRCSFGLIAPTPTSLWAISSPRSFWIDTTMVYSHG